MYIFTMLRDIFTLVVSCLFTVVSFHLDGLSCLTCRIASYHSVRCWRPPPLRARYAMLANVGLSVLHRPSVVRPVVISRELSEIGPWLLWNRSWHRWFGCRLQILQDAPGKMFSNVCRYSTMCYTTWHYTKTETPHWRAKTLTLETVFLTASSTKPLTSGKHGCVYV